ncbi:NAD(P)/FAD-dependent oxidoreductase [Pseudomonas mangiferae]|uniref:Pyridine nucleotide-disulfide oxidoreductase n=1 Tax=Pseudomonas mangiferae TaxID=2593654 RepID=A0A553GXE5_9PSED|nr:FAD-dependent oxidoreductase [Pseudomonas mangiferae]TRX74155.1 pyridine nucleotide-disulfide oxidoreductase [Pseudomonas mangiferae]
MDQGIIIVGSGQAAFQLAGFLRDEGYTGRIRLVGDEAHLPYQRPPLSKAYMNGECEADGLSFQTRDYYARRGIDLHLGSRVTRIDRAARQVETADGERLGYAHLVLATGARNRTLPGLDPAGPVPLDLRSLDDARAIRERLASAADIVVIGAGFLGLEFAAVAAKKGARVTVVEAGPGLMGRAVCGEVSDAFRRHQEGLGVTFRLGATLTALQAADGGARVTLSTGESLVADLVVVSIGVQPNVELAEQAGLRTANGILVDAHLGTDDPAISAIGDCAAFESRFALGFCRIESVQNAMDQARCVARRLTGQAAAYDAVPWFWSDQGGLKLQIAGLSTGADEVVVRGDPAVPAFSAYRFRGGELVAVESVARPTDHMAARRLLSSGARVTPAQVRDATLDLKTLLPASPAAAPTA